MAVLGILILVILLWVIPTAVGSCFADVDKKAGGLPFMWISGQILLWAGFQLLCVPVILKRGRFWWVVIMFSIYIAVLLLLSAFLYWRRRKANRIRLVKDAAKPMSKWHKASWLVFWALLLFQLYHAVAYAYGDGDDAFYVAMAGMAEDSDVMYQKIAYTGWPSELDVRHGMAPFPIWISYLTRVSGIKAVSVAHIAMPLTLICMTYAIYYLLGAKLFARQKERIPLFLIFTELLVLFGNYSFYTVETFMIARSRQGKAALGSIIIPMLFLLLFLLLEKMQENQRLTFGYWILLAATMTAGCLCSTMGALLVCMLIGITGLCAAVCYKKWKFLFPMAACCLPCVVYAGLYLILG